MADVVTFKKRTASKGNLRKKSDDGDEEEIDLTNLNDIKLQQNMRVRNTGTDINNLVKKKIDTPAIIEGKTLETVMGSQFSLQSENSHQGAIPHDKMMEKYVEEKLGLADNKRLVLTRRFLCNFNVYVTHTAYRR